MKESEKIIRFFVIATIWILFVTVTLAGLVTAAEKTEYINSGKETETIICRGLSMSNVQFTMYNDLQ